MRAVIAIVALALVFTAGVLVGGAHDRMAAATAQRDDLATISRMQGDAARMRDEIALLKQQLATTSGTLALSRRLRKVCRHKPSTDL